MADWINRFEIKFILSMDSAQKLRRALIPFCKTDSHAVEGAYKVSSLYYDSMAFDAYREKIDGEGMRVKLRVRAYGDDPGADASIEMKKRINNIVEKERAMVARGDWRGLLGPWSQAQEIRGRQEEWSVRVIDKARYLIERDRLVPKIVVTYRREAWEGKFDDRLRITFDTDLRAQTVELDPYSRLKGDSILDPRLCVVEIKFNDTFPAWLTQIIQAQSLDSRRISKYSSGVTRLVKAAFA